MGGKATTSVLPIVQAPQPSRVTIPLGQHMGAPCKPLVQKGDLVKIGQIIGEPVGFMSAAVHASVSGKVLD
ncbi:MAG: electron transport complex subunit RsxC, partial [Clostridia bacterium]